MNRLCGLNYLDAMFRAPALIALGSRPSQGKTSFILDAAARIAFGTSAVPAAIFSPDMPRAGIISRLIAAESEIPLNYLQSMRPERMRWSKIADAAARISAGFYIDDTADITVPDLRSRVVALQAELLKNGTRLGIVAIDSLESLRLPWRPNIKGRGMGEEILSSLRELSRTIGAPVLFTFQIGRQAGVYLERKKMSFAKIPVPKTVLEGADIMLLLYRERLSLGVNANMRMVVMKNAHGPTGKFFLNLDYSGKFSAAEGTRAVGETPGGFNL